MEASRTGSAFFVNRERCSLWFRVTETWEQTQKAIAQAHCSPQKSQHAPTPLRQGKELIFYSVKKRIGHCCWANTPGLEAARIHRFSKSSLCPFTEMTRRTGVTRRWGQHRSLPSCAPSFCGWLDYSTTPLSMIQTEFQVIWVEGKNIFSEEQVISWNLSPLILLVLGIKLLAIKQEQ